MLGTRAAAMGTIHLLAANTCLSDRLGSSVCTYALVSEASVLRVVPGLCSLEGGMVTGLRFLPAEQAAWSPHLDRIQLPLLCKPIPIDQFFGLSSGISESLLAPCLRMLFFCVDEYTRCCAMHCEIQCPSTGTQEAPVQWILTPLQGDCCLRMQQTVHTCARCISKQQAGQRGPGCGSGRL